MGKYLGHPLTYPNTLISQVCPAESKWPRTNWELGNQLRKSVWVSRLFPSSPAPYGLSGSPVWLLWDDKGLNDPSKNHIVGVVTEQDSLNKAIKATDIKIAIEMIRNV